MTQPSQDSLRVLESLRAAVAKALERKRLLNQYAVIWQDGRPVILGEVSAQEASVREQVAKYKTRDE
jgi:hypothetical protein